MFLVGGISFLIGGGRRELKAIRQRFRRISEKPRSGRAHLMKRDGEKRRPKLNWRWRNRSEKPLNPSSQTADWRLTKPVLSIFASLLFLLLPLTRTQAQKNSVSVSSGTGLSASELKDSAAQDEVTRLRKALADALALLDKKESDAKAAQALIEKLEAELKAANETLAASKSETQAANKVIAAADQALTAQSKALEMTERANERLLMLADRYEARVATLEKRVDSANKRGFWGTVGGIIGGVLIGRRF